MEYIEIYATAIATIMIVLGIAWKMNKEVGTLWKRFDQYKRHLEETHVSKEVCGILHNQICEDIVEIKADGKATQKLLNELLLLVKKNGNGK